MKVIKWATSAFARANRETLRLKFRNGLYLPLTKGLRARKLRVRDFTIISNNCWGGTIYESYGLRKETPTVGMFIMPEDYVRFCTDLPHYLAEPLEFIKPSESRYESVLGTKDNWGTYLIGRVGDVELHMLHHHDEDVARRKWESRVGRVNWDRIIYKFNDQNGATEADLVDFNALPLEHKVIFAAKEHSDIASCVKIHCPRNADFIAASYEPFGHNLSFDVTRFINESF